MFSGLSGWNVIADTESVHVERDENVKCVVSRCSDASNQHVNSAHSVKQCKRVHCAGLPVLLENIIWH